MESRILIKDPFLAAFSTLLKLTSMKEEKSSLKNIKTCSVRVDRRLNY